MLEIYTPIHGYDSIYSDEGINFDMDDSAFVNGYNIRVEEDYDNNFFRDAWY